MLAIGVKCADKIIGKYVLWNIPVCNKFIIRIHKFQLFLKLLSCYKPILNMVLYGLFLGMDPRSINLQKNTFLILLKILNQRNILL